VRLQVPDGVLDCDAVLFDLDGVLVDSLAQIEEQLRAWATEHGLDAQAVVDASPGRTNPDLVAEVAPHLDPVVEDARLEAREVAAAGRLRACPGGRELLDGLPRGAWAVVTSGARPVALARLAAAGLPVPAVLVAAGDVSVGKPDPQGYRLAARLLGVPPGRCVVVEDAVAGLRAAASAGMRALAVSADGTALPAPSAHTVRSLSDVTVTAPS